MNPYALPRASSRRVRHIVVRSHFNQPATRARLGVSPFRSIDVGGIVRAVVCASPLLLIVVALVTR